MLSAFVPTAATATTNSLLIPAIPDLVWGSLAFIVVLIAFVWKVVPRMNAALDARADAIEGGLKRAEEAQAGAQQALENYNAQLAEARAEASRIRDAAREDAKKIRAELVEQAQADANRIVANAQTQIEAERTGALVSLRAEVGTLALDLASGVIGEALDDDKRATAYVDRFLADMELVQSAEAKATTAKAKAGR
ncbi:MAG: F0F1 ATP synthase subunit B [Actinomycetota bacterium]|nr:F0F1 ATP synthase subunit B [Actinomycetota bacterium]